MNKRKKYHGPHKATRLSSKKVFLFKVIGILISFLILCLLEISLRVFHYGRNLDLFIEYPTDKNYLLLNPDASKRYFTNQAIATTGNVELFKKEKDANTLRIFVLGESTTIGYPYFHNGSFHRWLQYRLMHCFPEKNFEIINISLTAVNSYTILGFAKELVNYQPDAVLIYTGHNEYYGTLGVGSTDKIGNNRLVINFILKLRSLRLVQLMTNTYEKVVGLFSTKSNTGKTRMGLMVADQQIPYQSKLFKIGIDQYKANMDEAMNVLNRDQIPVFISNLVSNEKNLKPFMSEQVDSIRFPNFKIKYALGLHAFENKDLPAAGKYFAEANQIYSSHALCNYYLGVISYRQGDFKKAKAYFSNAKDLDGLRFRAPHQMNEIILQLCSKYQNTHLVDTKALFETRSQNNIIGDELILEHVHPNLVGYALMADAFYEALKKQNIFSIPKEKEMSFEKLLKQMPITEVDSLTGLYKILKLKMSWPFTEEQVHSSQPTDSILIDTEEKRLAYNIAFKQTAWPDAIDSLYNYYIAKHDVAKAKTVVETLVLEHPNDEVYYEKTANLCGELKDFENAIFYFKKAFYLAPSFDKAKYLFVIYFKLDKPADALPYLDYAINHTAFNSNLLPIKSLAVEIIQLQKRSSKDSTDILVLNQIANKYLKMGNQEGASIYAEKILKIDGRNKEALSIFSQTKNEKGS